MIEEKIKKGVRWGCLFGVLIAFGPSSDGFSYQTRNIEIDFPNNGNSYLEIADNSNKTKTNYDLESCSDLNLNLPIVACGEPCRIPPCKCSCPRLPQSDVPNNTKDNVQKSNNDYTTDLFKLPQQWP